jgi:hypothetical protein
MIMECGSIASQIINFDIVWRYVQVFGMQSYLYL